MPFGAASPAIWILEAGDIIVLRKVRMSVSKGVGATYHNLNLHSDRRGSAIIVINPKSGRISCRWPASAVLRDLERERIGFLRKWSSPRLVRAPIYKSDFSTTIENVLAGTYGTDRSHGSIDLVGLVVGAIVGVGREQHLVTAYPPTLTPL